MFLSCNVSVMTASWSNNSSPLAADWVEHLEETAIFTIKAIRKS